MDRNRPFTSRHAFTLIELLVVIAIIALLLSIVAPALKNAKRYAAAAVCLANENQLGKAYYLYAEDHDSLIMDGDTSDRSGVDAGYEYYDRSSLGESSNYKVHCWVGQPMSDTRSPVNLSIDDKVRGYKAGSLWSYFEAPKAYHCPADNRFLDSTSVGMLGYRSYSIGKPLSKRPGRAPENQSEIIRISQFVSPGEKIIFLEEAEKERGWNHRTWNMDMNAAAPRWVDPFAIFHNDSSTFVFADGHAERHKWTEKQTRDMAAAGAKDWTAVDPATKTYNDWLWMRKAYIPGRKPAGL